jgi:hypothetical protein
MVAASLRIECASIIFAAFSFWNYADFYAVRYIISQAKCASVSIKEHERIVQLTEIPIIRIGSIRVCIRTIASTSISAHHKPVYFFVLKNRLCWPFAAC